MEMFNKVEWESSLTCFISIVTAENEQSTFNYQMTIIRSSHVMLRFSVGQTCPVWRAHHQRCTDTCTVEQLDQPWHLIRVVHEKLLWFIHRQPKLCPSQWKHRYALLDLYTDLYKYIYIFNLFFLTYNRAFTFLFLFSSRPGFAVRHWGSEMLQSVFKVRGVTDVGFSMELTGCRVIEETPGVSGYM